MLVTVVVSCGSVVVVVTGGGVEVVVSVVVETEVETLVTVVVTGGGTDVIVVLSVVVIVLSEVTVEVTIGSIGCRAIPTSKASHIRPVNVTGKFDGEETELEYSTKMLGV